jgi:glutamine amidotransferase
VTVLDYGIGNLLNVVRALEHHGARVTVATKASEVLTLPDRLVLPGVGAFGDAAAELRKRGFDDLIHCFVATQRPFLGICVGAQLLFDIGEEHGEHAGLGLIPGRVQVLPDRAPDGTRLRIPHIGWSALTLPCGRRNWQGTPLARLEPGASVYFVHSYMPVPVDPADRLADTDYHGVRICAAVARDNVFGVQFHPERSAATGLCMLQTFLHL